MAYRSSSINSGTSATASVTVPSGVATNDIVVLVLSADTSGANLSSIMPTGFTVLDSEATTFDGESMIVAWKRPTGADSGSYTTGSMGQSFDWVMQALSFSGRDTTNPPAISSANISNTGHSSPITVTANGVTAVAGDDLIWIAAMDDDGSNRVSTFTPPSGYTLQESHTHNFSANGTATFDSASAGATGSVSGTVALTTGQSAWVSWLVRLPAVSSALPGTPWLAFINS